MATDQTPAEPASDDDAAKQQRVTKGAIIGLTVAVIAIGGGLYASQRVGTAPEVADALAVNAATLSGPIDPALLKGAECEKTGTEFEYHCVLKDGTDLNVVYEEESISRRLIGAKLDRSPGSDAEVTELVNRELKALAKGEKPKTLVCSTSIGFEPNGTAQPDITGFLCVEPKVKDGGQTRFLQFAGDGSLLRDYVVDLGSGTTPAPGT